MARRYFVFAQLFLLLFIGTLKAEEVTTEKKISQEANEGKTKEDTYECKHCGLMMQVKDPDEKCDVCRCGKTAFECKEE